MSARESLQKTKVGLILCSCFFAYGTYWSDWVFDYYMLWANPSEHPGAVNQAALYYSNQIPIPNILRYVPIANLIIAASGFATGLCTRTDGDILFDGASLVLMFFGIITYTTSVIPAVKIVTLSDDIEQTTVSLKQIAASHFIIVLAITGIIGLQITHYFIMKKSEKEEEFEDSKELLQDEDDDDDDDDDE
ncbi:ER membrane protein SH3 [Sporodiniella umbellata]|nr:ER membrane protein SH3 [Sporodiniella umbellata]